MERRLSLPFWNDRVRLWTMCALLTLLALVPVGWVFTEAAAASRNIAYWDEIDSALALLLRATASPEPGAVLADVFATTNEHRTVTSRLLFLASYWLTGTVDFRWVGWVGNGFLLAACGTLLAGFPGAARRVRLGVVLGFALFQLESHENFLWSGSSIDHFQVVAFALGAIVLLHRGSAPALAGAGACGVLGSLTLAHGLVVWPAGLAMLALARRWRHFAIWAALGAGTAGWFLTGFTVNASESFAAVSLGGVVTVVRYWLTLLGAPLALGQPAVAVVLGAWLVAIVALRSRDWTAHRTDVALPVLWFVLGATALIAVGRAELSHGQVYSRYMVLGGLGWALVAFAAIEHWTRTERPFRALLWCLPGVIAFNVAANARFAADAATWVEHRDCAALLYRRFGADGKGAVWLHPNPQHATSILTAAARQGIYRVPTMCVRRDFPAAKPSGRISYCVDEFTLNDQAAYLAGWAAIPRETIERGQLHVVLTSDQATQVFSTVSVRRTDVVAAYQEPKWLWSGFRFAVRRSRLPPGDYRVGFLIDSDDGAEFIMTDHKLALAGRGAALLAGGQ
ncbi:MAG: hypothetical protein HZA93_23365 [Verrucomicrobia bacterium]|nr:hypothetical protein [Verrucomicrobiota bacterium]